MLKRVHFARLRKCRQLWMTPKLTLDTILSFAKGFKDCLLYSNARHFCSCNVLVHVTT